MAETMIEYNMNRMLEEDDPCAAVLIRNYNHEMHVVAVFVILVASAVGVGIPLLSKYNSTLNIYPYLLSLGKCAGCGVMLSCALVHMILPSTESLTSECVPKFFNTTYPAFSYFIATMAALSVHLAESILTDYLQSLQSTTGTTNAPPTTSTAIANVPHNNNSNNSRNNGSNNGLENEIDDNNNNQIQLSENNVLDNNSNKNSSIDNSVTNYMDLESKTVVHRQEEELRMKQAKQFSEALMVEISISIHSVLVGLAVGVTDYSTLIALLVALIFHQLFEGVAIGCRLSDGEMGLYNDLLFAIIFTISAPLGIIIGIGLYNTLNTSGATFLLVEGLLDGICGGILLYNAFLLLLIDFPKDVELHCSNNNAGPYRSIKKSGMFITLWISAGLMSLIGAYL